MHDVKNVRNMRSYGRTIAYKLTAKLLTAAALGGVWCRLGNTAQLYDGRRYVCSGAVVIFLTMAWFSFLAFDGVKIPRLKQKTRRRLRRWRGFDFSEMMETGPDSFEEMTERERDFCGMASSLLCAAVCFLAALW